MSSVCDIRRIIIDDGAIKRSGKAVDTERGRIFSLFSSAVIGMMNGKASGRPHRNGKLVTKREAKFLSFELFHLLRPIFGFILVKCHFFDVVPSSVVTRGASHFRQFQVDVNRATHSDASRSWQMSKAGFFYGGRMRKSIYVKHNFTSEKDFRMGMLCVKERGA